MPWDCSTEDDNAAAEFAAHLVDEIAHGAALEAIDALDEQLDAFDIDGAGLARSGGGGLHARGVELAAELLHLFFLRGDARAEGVGGSGGFAADDLVDGAGDVEVAAELAERAEAADGFDAADAGGDGAFAD